MRDSDNNGIPCTCNSTSKVIDSRPQSGVKRYRRRRCDKCGSCFSTYEITAEEYERLQSVKINMFAITEAIRALEVVRKAVRR